MKILLIAGGWSTEREVSLAGAAAIEKTLVNMGYQVTFCDLLKDFKNFIYLATVHDFVFINLHGKPGEDGLIQAMLDAIHKPYQGSGAAASFLALNKAASKELFKSAGLPVAEWEFLTKMPGLKWQPSLKWPIFVKSNTGGSSLRLGLAHNKTELNNILQEIFNAGDEAILEEALEGADLTCGILGMEPLPPVLIEPQKGAFFNYNSKYDKNGAKEICPAPISDRLTKLIQKLALKAHKVLGLSGYSRADFILDENKNLTLLEVNTLPGMTATSLVPQEAEAAGIAFPQLLQRLIDLGMQRCSHDNLDTA